MSYSVRFGTALVFLILAAFIASPCHRTSKFVASNSQLAVKETEFNELRFHVVRVPDDLRFYWTDAKGTPFRTFSNLDRQISAQNETLLFATNGGIFEPDLVPTGLWTVDGHNHVPLNLSEGDGNFFLKPNGVFFSDGSIWQILPADEFARREGPIVHALQSGPLLVHRGNIHPAFSPTSSSRFVRSGVGVSNTDGVFIALSLDEVTFYEFATFFREHLDCDNALYLDGVISQFYWPGARVEDRDYATFLAIVE